MENNRRGDLSDTAVLLIAHGSRLKSANDDLVKLAEMVRTRALWPQVEIAYLELAEPSILQAAAACVENGAKRVLMLPYFLSHGAHVSDDLDRLRSKLARDYPNVSFVLCSPLGLHPLLIDIVMDRLKQGESHSR